MNVQAVKLPASEWAKLISAVVIPAAVVLMWVGRVGASVDVHTNELTALKAENSANTVVLIRISEQIAELRGEVRGRFGAPQ